MGILGWLDSEGRCEVGGLDFQKELGKLMGRQPLTITPMMYYGRPLLAGTEGMRTDDIWVHMHDKMTSFKDIPAALLGTIMPGRKSE